MNRAILMGGALLSGLIVDAGAEEIAVKGAVIDLQFTAPPPKGLAKVAKTWIENSAKAVATYYGSFPAKGTVLNATPTAGKVAENGEASGWFGLQIKIQLGRDATDATLREDWVLTHEMLHLCFPTIPDKHLWLEEGLATYVEPFARARAGLITPETAWAGLMEGLPDGLPQAGDQGLDHTHTWGRTYWGGALFCFRADLEIRKRTGNRKGLEHALRAIADAGGTVEKQWSIDRVIALGDKGTGVPVLRELYDEMKAKPVTVDLAALWKSLGVERHGKTVRFVDDAPLAAIRKAITGL